jgi:hypothetical protein
VASISLRNLSGGELAPAFYAKTDIAKYQSGLRTCRNWMVQKSGGLANRAGFQYICEVKNNADTTRLLPFIFNSDQTYALEFGDEYMRVIRNGAQVEVSGVAAWDSGATYATGNLVSKSSVNYYAKQASTNKDPATETAYWYALTGDIYEMPSPYDKADLFDLKYIQSADVVSIVENGYAPRDLTRTGHTAWTIGAMSFTPLVTAPTNVAVAGTAGAGTYVYHVTAVDPDTFEESLAGTKSQGSLAEASASQPHTITWTAVSGVTTYYVYIEKSGYPSYIGIAGTNSFTNNGITPDYDQSPPVARDPFPSAAYWPATIAYVQQRLTMANSTSDVEKIFMSKSANFKNFTVGLSVEDDDAVTFTVAGSRVNAVKHIVSAGSKNIVLTSSAEIEISGDEAGIITPAATNPKTISYYGSSDIQPLIIGSAVIFVQARNNVVRDLYEDLVEGTGGSDLTIFASHLFEGKQIVSWAYQQVPNSIIWVVLDDGQMLGLTYLRDHKVWAWHRHDTDGLFKDVIAIPEGNEDAVYVIVERVIDGNTKKYIERMYSRYFADPIDGVFMDSALSYDGWHTGSTTMTLTGTGWAYNDSLTLTASASTFVAGDVGNEIWLVSGETTIRCRIIAYTSATVVTVNPHKDVPVAMQSVAITEWGKAVDTLSGLGHLEGKDIAVYADGFVVASPNNSAYEEIEVASGVAQLDKPYMVIHAGLPYISDAETLDVDNFGGASLATSMKLITEIGLYVQDALGLFAGSKPPTGTDPLEGLFELKVRYQEAPDDPNTPLTGFTSIKLQTTWNSNGRAFIRQVDPVPAKILALYPTGLISQSR